MDIRAAIDEATRIPWKDDHAVFIPRTSPSQAEKDRRMNQRKKKPARNLHLVEQEDKTSNDNSYEDTQTEPVLNEHEIACSINAVNGGINYSNEFIESYWRSEQMKNNGSPIESDNSVISHTNEDLSAEEKLRKCKLSRNAAITGLLRKNEISVEDLQMPGDIEKKPMALVPHPEDPDVFIQRVQAYEGLNQRKHKDNKFIVNHVGKKTTITPTQFYINEIDDSAFRLVKKDSPSK